MSAGNAALLLGLFGVPAVLLWIGHDFRDRTPAQRSAFWGGLTGFVIATLVTLAVTLLPPEEWSGGRELLVRWSLISGAAVGAGAGLLARAVTGRLRGASPG